VVTAEEVFELKIPLPDVVSMQCRQPSLEGTGEIKLRRLVKEALRMRPSRIVVGEVAQACERAGVLIAPGTEWFPAEPPGPFLRLNFSGPNPAAFREAAQILGESLDRQGR